MPNPSSKSTPNDLSLASFPTTAAGQSLSLTVQRSLPGERLDTFLRSQFPTVSRGTFQRLLAQGYVLVDNRPVKPTHEPRAGEQIAIHWPEPTPAVARPEAVELDILHEDDELLVLNKPAGMVVHPSAGHDEHTLVNALLHHCQGKLSGVGGVARPGIVHRLDQETSGCLVVAKSDRAHLALARQFAQREIRKIYLAIVCGHLAPPSGDVRVAIARHPSHRKRMAVTEGHGRDAWTSYRTIEILRCATFVEAQLHTGRTHQIRVHFQHLGFPLAGDPTYGKRSNIRLTELTRYHAPRQMLHAFQLSFVHPLTRKPLTCEAPLPLDFMEALESLKIDLCNEPRDHVA
jgi:23S rRNA pseudouridine1911/1915/1917 synthase